MSGSLDRVADSECAMMKAEKASVFEPAGYVAAARHGPRQLLDRLERVLAG